MKFALLIIGAYLLGSVPFGLIIAKAYGKNLREIGSGNIGATNLSRAVGKKWAYVCFLLDTLKGFIPMFAAVKIISSQPNSTELLLTLAVGFACVLGHIFSVYIKFKGGKGVATSFGIAIGLWPYYTISGIAAFIVWIIFVLIWRYISLASIAAAIVFPVTLAAAIVMIKSWNLAELWPLLIAAVVIPIMVIVKHRQNIKRLIAGTESKISSRK